jgi:hypothetical protein
VRPANGSACGERRATADLDSSCARRRDGSAVGTEEWLRRGRTKEWMRQSKEVAKATRTMRDTCRSAGEDARIRPGQAGSPTGDAAPIPKKGRLQRSTSALTKRTRNWVSGSFAGPARIGGGSRRCPRANLDRPAERQCHAPLRCPSCLKEDRHVKQSSMRSPYHPSVSPDRPEGRQPTKALQAGLDAAKAALEERDQAASHLFRTRVGRFFSTGSAACSAAHMPVETAQ